MKTSTIAIALFCAAAAVTLLATSMNNDDLRTKIRYDAATAGVHMSNVWTRIDVDRQLVMMGGALGSTQELFKLFAVVIAYRADIATINQSITTPQGCPFPPEFPVGFDPFAKKTSAAARTHQP